MLGAGDLSASNQPEWYDGFAAIQAYGIFQVDSKVASQRHLEQGHQKSTTILDACFHRRGSIDSCSHTRN